MKIYEKLLDWMIPGLLAATVYSLVEIRNELASMSVSLAVAVTKIDEHEKRIARLEDAYAEPSRGLPEVWRHPVQRPAPPHP